MKASRFDFLIRFFQKPVWVIAFALLLNLAVKVWYVNEPPFSQHTWRQTTTLMVAENFYQEDMNILYPRVSNRNITSGVTGMHFPLYEWVTAFLYGIFGDHYAIHRLLSFFFGALGTIGIYFFSKSLFDNTTIAAISAWFYAWAPELFFNHFIALPDVIALPATIWGIYFFNRAWSTRNDSKYFVPLLLLSAISLCTGGLVKLQYLGAGAFVAGIVWRDRFEILRKVKTMISLLLYALITIVPVLLWYARSKKMIAESGLADVGLELKPAESLEKALQILLKNITADIPEIMFGWLAFFCFIAAAVFIIKRKSQWEFKLPFIFLSLVYLAYHLIELRVIEIHQYYMMPYYPLLLPIAAWGAWRLIEKYGKPVLFLLIFLHPLLCFARMVPARFANENKMIHDEFYDKEMRTELRNAVPDSVLVMVGPDISGCIYFHFLQKRGWSFATKEDFQRNLPSGDTWIDFAINNGCQYLYTDDESVLSDPFLQKRVKDTVKIVGDFKVLRLKEKR